MSPTTSPAIGGTCFRISGQHPGQQSPGDAEPRETGQKVCGFRLPLRLRIRRTKDTPTPPPLNRPGTPMPGKTSSASFSTIPLTPPPALPSLPEYYPGAPQKRNPFGLKAPQEETDEDILLGQKANEQASCPTSILDLPLTESPLRLSFASESAPTESAWLRGGFTGYYEDSTYADAFEESPEEDMAGLSRRLGRLMEEDDGEGEAMGNAQMTRPKALCESEE